MADTWELQGLKELGETIDKLIKGVNPDKIEPALNEGARKMAGVIRKNIRALTKDNNRIRGRSKGRIRLRYAVVVKKLRPFSWNTPTPSIAALDFWRAPHAHLVEYGHKMPNGGRVEGKGFFRKSVDEAGGDVVNIVAKAVDKIIEEAIK